MSIVHEHRMSPEALERAFDAAEYGGYRYLIHVQEKTGDAEASRHVEYTRALVSADGIVPLLRRIDRTMTKSDNTIIGVYDLTQDWAAQKSNGMAACMQCLPEKTRLDLQAYYESRQKARELWAAQRDWAAQPLIRRLFTAKPASR
jgi:hypothetical protein